MSGHLFEKKLVIFDAKLNTRNNEFFCREKKGSNASY
jgi:hypothetical protein